MVAIAEVGRGVTNARQNHKNPLGEARLSLNFLHGNFEGETYDRAELREYLDRAWLKRTETTRIDLMVELRKDDGTRGRFFKSNSKLYSWSTSPGSLPVEVASGMHANATQLTDVCQGFDRLFFADVTENWAYSTTNGLFLLTPSARPTTAMTLTEAGAAVGFGTGIFEYNYTLYSSSEGWETRPRSTSTTITKASADLGVRWTNPADPGLTGIYNRYRLYRRLQGENAWYLIGTYAASDFTVDGNKVQDDVPDLDLEESALSEIHDNESGLDDYTVPDDFSTIAFYRGRVFGASGDTVWWSKVNLPFLFRESEIARKQIGDDGDPVIALRVINESLVCFKRHSIWILNGDVEESGFTWFPNDKMLGLIGLNAVTLVPGGCMFLANDRSVYYFDLSQDSVRKPISTTVKFTANWTKANFFAAGYDPESRHAQFSFPAAADTNNTETHTVSIDGFAWGRAEYLLIYPQCYTVCHNANAEAKLYFGSHNGYGYQTMCATGADGVNSGTKSGTVNVGTSTTVFSVNYAAFMTTGAGSDALKGLSASVMIAGAVETREISSNTATEITVTSAFSATPQAGALVWIGAMSAVLWFHRVKIAVKEARVDDMYFFMDESSTTWKFGATIDNETDRDHYTEDTAQESIHFKVERRCYSMSPFIESFGTSLEMDFGGVEFEPTLIKGDR